MPRCSPMKRAAAGLLLLLAGLLIWLSCGGSSQSLTVDTQQRPVLDLHVQQLVKESAGEHGLFGLVLVILWPLSAGSAFELAYSDFIQRVQQSMDPSGVYPRGTGRTVDGAYFYPSRHLHITLVTLRKVLSASLCVLSVVSSNPGGAIRNRKESRDHQRAASGASHSLERTAARSCNTSVLAHTSSATAR